MNTIYLHGSLAEKFGESYSFAVDTMSEAVRALCYQVPGFKQHIEEGEWQVTRGRKNREAGVSDEEEFNLLLGSDDVHIMPAGVGAGGGGGKVLMGAVMVGAAFMTGGASMAAWGFGSSMLGTMGAGMVLGGVATMLTPMPKTTAASEEKNTQSFLFNGTVNVDKQGVPVPLIYGKMLVGSVVISSAITAEDYVDD